MTCSVISLVMEGAKTETVDKATTILSLNKLLKYYSLVPRLWTTAQRSGSTAQRSGSTAQCFCTLEKHCPCFSKVQKHWIVEPGNEAGSITGVLISSQSESQLVS